VNARQFSLQRKFKWLETTGGRQKGSGGVIFNHEQHNGTNSAPCPGTMSLKFAQKHTNFSFSSEARRLTHCKFN